MSGFLGPTCIDFCLLLDLGSRYCGTPAESGHRNTQRPRSAHGRAFPAFTHRGLGGSVMLRADSAQSPGSRFALPSGSGPDPLMPAVSAWLGRVFSYPKGDPGMPRLMYWGRRSIAAAIALVIALPALAGTTGKLTGHVTDDKKQPLAGVNVRVEGQRLGGITDDQGNYFIIGILGGKYTIKMDLIGYAPFVAENVEIQPDFSTTLDAVMRTEAVQMNEVVVNAERPLLQKDVTGSTKFISGNEIEKLPVRGYRDAVAQQSGVVNFARQIDRESTN